MASNALRWNKFESTLPPCALRYHPSVENLLFIGTYELDKSNNTRFGTIEIYNEKILIHLVKTDSAILDLKFDPFNDEIIYTAGSTGDFKVWEFKNNELKLIEKFQLFEADVLITSINTSNVLQNKILLTTTDGYVSLLTLTNNKGSFNQNLEFFDSFHSLQCWISSFGNFNELANVIFSGGDDATLIAHDLRTMNQIFKSNRLHDAGIVSIRTSTPGNHHGNNDWSITKPYTLLTGSYDDHIRDLDLRYVPDHGLVEGLTPKLNEKLNLGGGVWKLEPCVIPGDNRLAVCCMYDGARILESDPFRVDRYFKKEHESMVYGCDWSLDGTKIASCSFYDKVVQIWSVNDVE